MTHLHDEIRIEAPVEHVWKLFCDVSHWKDWMPWGEFSHFSGPVDEVGTTFVARMRLVGYEMKSSNEVVGVEPQRLYHERSDFGSMDQYMRFEPAGDSTRVVFDADYEMPGKLLGFLKDLLSKGWMERHMRNMLTDFKALAEARVPAPA
jgi:uncharacterized membrane protein